MRRAFVGVAVLATVSGSLSRITGRERLLGHCGNADVRTRARLAPGRVTGRYAAGDDLVFLAVCGAHGGEDEDAPDTVAASPALWESIEYLLRVGPDSFAVADRPQRTIALERGTEGRVEAVRMTGFAIGRRLARVALLTPLPVEHLLFDADAMAAVEALTTGTSADPGRSATLAGSVFFGFPSRRVIVADVIRRLSERWPSSLELAVLEADAFGMIGRPTAAREALARARTLAPADSEVRRVQVLLDGGTSLPDTGWRVPFTTEAVLAGPTAAEVASTWSTIAARDRAARDVRVLDREMIVVHQDSFSVVIIAHVSAGHRHVGAIVAPVSPLPRCCGTIVDIKGTNASYRPLALDRGPPSLRMLGTAALAYIYVVPAIRGEVLTLGGRSFQAEGVRTDGWDGGADDALTLLAAAASIDRRVDPRRACTFGRSRGGAVALLAAERDGRIRCAVAIAGPTDWFDAMWANGWDKSAALRIAMRTRATPFQRAGQFVEWFMLPVVRGEWTLDDARRRMIASSPLYYAHRLPATLAFYGEEDGAVPLRNAVLLEAAFARMADRGRDHSVHVAPMAGHDTDPAEVVRGVPAFLARHLGAPVGRVLSGADAR